MSGARIAAESRRETPVIALVSSAHGVSHFFHLVLPPMFPWLREAFGLSYAELGLLMTVLFTVSGIGQALAGFLVDRIGPAPVMQAALASFAAGALVLGLAPSWEWLVLGAALIGLGNAPFHPVDYSVLNARVGSVRLGHAYAMHGVAGSLGWALAPVYMVGLAQLGGWRTAFFGAAVLAALMLAIVAWRRELLDARRPAAQATAGAGNASSASASAAASAGAAGQLDFMRLPAVWYSFAFFFASAFALGGVQTFGPESARQLHDVPLAAVALCLSAYMLASAAGMIIGGFAATDPTRAERTIGLSFAVAALIAASLPFVPWPGVLMPVPFALMGLSAGIANPSRDLLIRRAAPPGATGRVYGVVYSGLDLGMSISPPILGLILDRGSPAGVWIGIAVAQLLMIGLAFRAASAAATVPAAAASAAGASATASLGSGQRTA